MTTDEARGSLWSGLVNGLLDARNDPATARFDTELATAVAAGELSRRTAQRLRFWQRAAVNAADDHARTVVPAVLDVLETARSEAQAYVEQGSATLDASVRVAEPPHPEQPSTAAQHAGQGPRPPDPIEDLRRASAAGGERPSTLEGPAPRLFLADLRDVAATDRS